MVTHAQVAPRRRLAELFDPRRLLGLSGVRLLASLMAGAAILLLWTVAPSTGVDGLGVPWWLVVAGFTVAELFVVHMPFGRNTYSFSLSEIPLTLALVSLSPLGSILARLAGSAFGLFGTRVRGVKLAFNLASAVLETVVAVVVYRLVLGDATPFGLRGWLAVIAAAVVVDVISGLTITAAISLTERIFAIGILSEVMITGLIAATTSSGVAVTALVVIHHDKTASVALVVVAAFVLIAYRAWSSLTKRYAHLELLHGFIKAVGDPDDREGVARSVLLEARTVMRANVAEIVLFGDDGDEPVRLRVDETDGITSGADDAKAWWRVLDVDRSSSYPHRSKDLDVRARLKEVGLRDAVVVPLRSADGMSGALLVANRLDDVTTFDDDDVQLLETLASHAGVELRNGQLLDRLRCEVADREYQALHDQLTELPNRRSFRARLQSALANGEHVAVLLRDLDRFKEINDTLGHAAGDHVLCAVAQRLMATVSPDTVVARLGGDEFALVLPTGSAEEVTRVATELLEVLEEPVPLEELAVDLGASIGAALAPFHGTDADVLIQRAEDRPCLRQHHGRRPRRPGHRPGHRRARPRARPQGGRRGRRGRADPVYAGRGRLRVGAGLPPRPAPVGRPDHRGPRIGQRGHHRGHLAAPRPSGPPGRRRPPSEPDPRVGRRPLAVVLPAPPPGRRHSPP
jgi:diguanylate cyclase (GGDEF)-like protein